MGNDVRVSSVVEGTENACEDRRHYIDETWRSHAPNGANGAQSSP